MLAHLASLRFRLLLAMFGAAVVGLAGAYYVYGTIEHGEERSIVRDEAAQAARAIAAQAASGASREDFRRDQAVLGDDQLVVVRGGRQVFAGRPIESELTATVTALFAGGRVTVVGHADEDPRLSLELTLVAAAVLLLVIAATIVTATFLARAIRRPIERAISEADRLAVGDLRARMGTAGPEEFARLGRAFDSMAERLEAADRSQRQFLGDLVHEIATPVNSISGFALAVADGSAQTPAEREEAATMISRETSRLQALLDDVRRLSHLQLLEVVEPERIDLRALCEELAARLAPLARTSGITLNVRAGALRLVSDRRLVETILVNFLTNAIRYSPAGGSVELTARRHSREVVIAVRDTGIGISAEHRARIFDRFYRVDDARARASGGSGLGLTIAHRAAQALGGRIELDSEPGVGSEFRLILPRLVASLKGRTVTATPRQGRGPDAFVRGGAGRGASGRSA